MTNPLGLSCPRGGDWYICQDTAVEFVGCCTINPCSDGSGNCPQKRLRPATFSSSQYSKIPALACDDSEPIPGYSSPLWYTCAANNPPFMGCCYSNPCTAGQCADANLTAARLIDEPVIRADFLRDAGAIEPSSSSKGLSGGAIAGIVIGVLGGIALVVGAWWYMRRRKQKQAAEKSPQSSDGLGLNHSPNPNSSHFTHSPHHCKYFFRLPGILQSYQTTSILTELPAPAAVSPHSGYHYKGSPPQGHGFENGSYYSAPTELGSPSHYVAELSGNHAGEVAMLDSKPVGHQDAHSPTIPPSTTTTTTGGWPQDLKK
ncbi:hypothetical protein V8F06_005773 [Rhypophila decipiens]